eukprot:TRINITY_DN67310_c0_g1_i1.p1 TRINITY_DN67310_c0_g1~~TRINITY_DN67310_c0_g1_i1.p1  ORF type:complete len:595 (+),score=64.13 TRINITY_DN67310_c0_g1_i1:119-1903(+)
MAAKSALQNGSNRCHGLWLRCDLRLDDNPALLAACEGATSLLPIYVFDPSRFNSPTLAGARKSTARRARFLLESVACLRRRLDAMGSGLVVVLSTPQDALSRYSDNCESVYVTQGIASEETTQEIKVEKALRHATLKRIWGGTLYLPEECGCSPDDVPLLFTNFKNKAESRGRIRDPKAAPAKLPPIPSLDKELAQALTFLPTLEQLGFSAAEARAAAEDDPRGVMCFEGGEVAALARLQSWMFDADRLKEYFEIRNGMLGEGYSSKLSPWFSLGCISPRRVWAEVQRYESQRVKNKSTYWLVFELTWRDFYTYLARSQGDKIFLRGGVIGDRTPWRGTRESLDRWKEGRTGDQLVDANMRELLATGFMSNRGRQNVASFLIFDLSVDWRYGAAHFEEHLLDYDPYANWGNWVAAAGLTGQRINRFNTRKQLNDYDPKREYVRHWLSGCSPVRLSAALTSSEGGVVRDGLSESERRKQARLERFGRSDDRAVLPLNPPGNSAQVDDPSKIEEDTRRARLERFAHQAHREGGKSGNKGEDNRSDSYGDRRDSYYASGGYSQGGRESGRIAGSTRNCGSEPKKSRWKKSGDAVVCA